MIESLEGLRPETADLWKRLRREPLLSGFILIGGSAISLHIHHRLSEDLDFAITEMELPGKRLDLLIRMLSDEGFDVQLFQNVSGEREFEDSAFSLFDFQRDFIINGVKVTMFSSDQELVSVLKSSGTKASLSGPVVADLPTLFASKSIVCAKRSRTRDWFDLFILMRDHGFNAGDMKSALDAHYRYGWDIAVHRLTKGEISPFDEGYSHLVSNPPTVEEMQNFFSREIARLESQLALEMMDNSHDIEDANSLGPKQ